MSRGTKRRRRRRLLFGIPMVVLVLLLVYTVLYFLVFRNGVLVVAARARDASGSYSQVQVTATVDGEAVLTPDNITVVQGEHTVSFPPVRWYVTPPSHTIYVDGGKTAYATGLYVPVKYVIGVSGSGFNDTAVSAEHGLNTVEWYNTGGTIVTIYIQTIGRIILEPGQHYSTIFQNPGAYPYNILSTTIKGTLTVS